MGSQLGTWITTWQTQVDEVVKEPYALIFIFETSDGKPLSATSELRLAPILQAKSIGANASGDAMEFILEHWNLRLTSCASGSNSESCQKH